MRLTVIVAFLTLFVACNSSSNSPAKPLAIPTLKMETLDKSSGPCETKEASCATIILEYPQVQAENGIDEATALKINAVIQEELIRTIAAFNPTDSLQLKVEAAADQFLNDYVGFLRVAPDYTIPWTIETEGQVLLNNGQILSVDLSTYSFTGGAHSNSSTSLLNFRFPEGLRFNALDVVTDRAALLQLAEAKFKEARELEANSDLGEEGFSFGNGTTNFGFPENIGFTKEGLFFFYNAYEVAAYVVGPTDFLIPYAELDGILDQQLVQSNK